MTEILGEKHIHLWTKSVDGAEFGNAVYDNNVDAALDFLGIIKDVTKYTIDNEDITIEHVMGSLTDGQGIYAGYPGFIVVLSKCDGGCNSPSWN